MAGEMSQLEVTKEAFPRHFALAKKFKGKVHAFDQYQGPFIIISGVAGKIWLISEDEQYSILYWYNDFTQLESSRFWFNTSTLSATLAGIRLVTSIVGKQYTTT